MSFIYSLERFLVTLFLGVFLFSISAFALGSVVTAIFVHLLKSLLF